MRKESIRRVKGVWEGQNKILERSEQVKLDTIFDSLATLYTIGPTYYFLFEWGSYEMQKVSESINDILGVSPSNFTLQYVLENMHPTDIEKFHEKERVGFDFLINFLDPSDLPLYKVVYLMRLKSADGSYKMILQQSRTVNVSKDGKVQQILVIHSDITNLNISMDHNISFISSARPSYFSVATKPPYKFIENYNGEKLTRREKEILNYVANGHTTAEISSLLHISNHTVSTHRKNIQKKMQCSTLPEMITKAMRKGLIY